MDNSTVSAIAALNPIGNAQSNTRIDMGYSASLTDIVSFEQSMNNAIAEKARVARTEEPSNTEKAVIKPLDFINNEAESIINYAKSAVESGNELTPSEIVTLTARSHEFMFHCQLTSNIANRTSDGLQQLFRQQN